MPTITRASLTAAFVIVLSTHGAAQQARPGAALAQALATAVSGGDYDRVRSLLARGVRADATVPTVGYTPLALAVRQCKARIAGLLAEHGADASRAWGQLVECQNSEDAEDIARALAAHGGVRRTDRQRLMHALAMRISGGSGEWVALARIVGAVPISDDPAPAVTLAAFWQSILRPATRDTTWTFLDRGISPDSRRPDGTPALSYAVTSRNYGAMVALLAHGANPALRDAGGHTALDIAEAMTERDPAMTSFRSLLRARTVTTEQTIEGSMRFSDSDARLAGSTQWVRFHFDRADAFACPSPPADSGSECMSIQMSGDDKLAQLNTPMPYRVDVNLYRADGSLALHVVAPMNIQGAANVARLQLPRLAPGTYRVDLYGAAQAWGITPENDQNQFTFLANRYPLGTFTLTLGGGAASR